jgi:hypothetical protein
MMRADADDGPPGRRENPAIMTSAPPHHVPEAPRESASPRATPPPRAARITRRTAVGRLGLGLGTILVAAAGGVAYRAYDQGVLEVGKGAAYEPWTNWRRAGGLRSLVGAAILAPSPHNAQAWLYGVGSDRIDLYADGDRWTGATDPFRRELYVGLGAALENLVLAAEAGGYEPRVTLHDAPGTGRSLAARVELARSSPRTPPLYAQIPLRHTNRYPYVAGRDVPATALSAMTALTDGSTPDARVLWFSGAEAKRQVGALLVEATEALMSDAAQSASDYAWFRQSWDEIQHRRDGITLDAAGLPDLTVAAAKLLPAQSRSATEAAWLKATRERHTRTAAAYGIVAVRDARANVQRLQGGRLLERVHLWATGNGIALHHMNQLTERSDRELQLGSAPRFGDALHELLPAGWQALSTFRIGYPTHTPHPSPRRRLEAVTV